MCRYKREKLSGVRALFNGMKCEKKKSPTFCHHHFYVILQDFKQNWDQFKKIKFEYCLHYLLIIKHISLNIAYAKNCGCWKTLGRAWPLSNGMSGGCLL